MRWEPLERVADGGADAGLAFAGASNAQQSNAASGRIGTSLNRDGKSAASAQMDRMAFII
jgi:hypothetical protein